MKAIVLPTRRAFDGRVFWALVALIIPAGFAIIPFVLNIQETFRMTEQQGWGPLIVDRVVLLIIVVILARIGLALAGRIGVGLPFLESWVNRGEPARRFRGVFAMGMLIGLGCAAVLIALESFVFREPMLQMFQEHGIDVPSDINTSPLLGLLAAFSAGVTEETLFRLFGLGLLAWLGGLLFHTDDGRPREAVFWTANVLIALVFASAHIANAVAVGWPINEIMLIRIFVLNGLAGIAFGWLFWTYGLESAMVAHFFTDVGLYTLVAAILMQVGDDTAMRIAIGAVALVVVIAVYWGVKALIGESVLQKATPTTDTSP